MFFRSLAGALILCALSSSAFGQKVTTSIPYNPNGVSVVQWTAGYVNDGLAGYPQGQWVQRNSQICFSLKFGNTGDPATDTADWACSAAPVTLQHNGTANGSQTKLNLVPGTGIGIADDGSGDLTLTSTGGTGSDVLDNVGTINSQPVQEYATFSRSPMATWLAALHDCNNRVVNLVALTDSYGMAYNNGTAGSAGPTNPNDRYLSQIRMALQTICPSHGTGLHVLMQQLSDGQTDGNGHNLVAPDSRYFGGVNGGNAIVSSAIGPSEMLNGTLNGGIAQLPAGSAFIFSSATDNIAYDTINTFCASGPGYGTWTVWKGDETQSGSGATQVGTCGNSGDSTVTAHMSSTALGTSAAQTVTFVCTGGLPCLYYGAQGVSGTVGVSVSPLTVASTSAEYYNGPTSFAFIALIPGGVQGLITNFGTNETNGGFSTSSYKSALQNIITQTQAITPNASVLMLTSPVSNTLSATNAPLYAAQAVSLAQTDANVDVANIIDRWGTNWTTWTSGASTNSIYFDSGSDGTHPGATGTLSEAALLFEHLVDTPFGGSSLANGGESSLASGGNVTGNMTFQVGALLEPWIIAPTLTGDPSGACSPVGSLALVNDGLGSLYQCTAASSGGAQTWNKFGSTSASPTFAGATITGALNVSTVVPTVTSAPSGSCSPDGTLVPVNDGTGHLYMCQSGSYVLFANPGTNPTFAGATVTGALNFFDLVPTNSTSPSGSCGPNGAFLTTTASGGQGWMCKSGNWTQVF